MESIIGILSDIISVPLKKWDGMKLGYKMGTVLLLVAIIVGGCIYF